MQVGLITASIATVLQNESIHWLAYRGSKAKDRWRLPVEENDISSKRQIVEKAFSITINMLPWFIKSRKENGFLIKVFCFFIAYRASFYGKVRSPKSFGSHQDLSVDHTSISIFFNFFYNNINEASGF